MTAGVEWLSPAARVLYLAATTTLVYALETRSPLAPPGGGRRRQAVNLGHWALVVALNLALALPAAGLLAWAETTRFGLARRLPLGPGGVAVLAVVALDLVAWAVHVALHKTPALWRVHRVHHNDPQMDVTTALRQHPIETVARVTAQLLGAVVLGLPEWALGLSIALSGVLAAFEHGNLRLPPALDRRLRLLLVTPAMHRVHHSRRVAETDSNYANVFAFWDRLAGTYREVADAAAVPIGLDGLDDPRSQSFLGLIALAFRAPPAEPEPGRGVSSSR